jgi:hypothetical protein
MTITYMKNLIQHLLVSYDMRNWKMYKSIMIHFKCKRWEKIMDLSRIHGFKWFIMHVIQINIISIPFLKNKHEKTQ